MKSVEIKAKEFFELLKLKDTSMWDIFAQMISGEERQLVFLSEENKVLFSYTLPKTLGELDRDREMFSKEYAERLTRGS